MPAKRNIIVALVTRVVICAALLAVAAIVFRYLVVTKVRPQPEDTARPAPALPVMIARTVEVRRQYNGYGTGRAMGSADVPARVNATVERIPEEIEPGAIIAIGDLIAELDSSDFQRQVEISTAIIDELDAQIARLQIEEEAWKRRTELAGEEVSLAKADFERIRGALERDAAKQREVDQARQALIIALRTEVAATEERDKLPGRRSGLHALKDSQQATLRLAEQNVERCRIVSPLEGVLQEVDVEIGENLASGQRVARVVSLSRVEVGLQLPASARPDVEVGDQVELRSTGAATHVWSAHVTRIAPEDDPSTRTTKVYVEVQQTRRDEVILAPGMFLQGTVTSSRRATRWVVPRRSVQSNRVTLVEAGTAVSQAVEVDYHLEGALPQLGVPDTQWLVLRSSLHEGDQVLLNATRLIAEGSRIQAIPAQATVASEAPAPSRADGAGGSP